MVFSKKYINLKADSILESVIALSIISICLYISVLVYASVFTPKTSSKFYISRNKITSMYYLSQINPDSIEASFDNKITFDKEWITPTLQKIKVEFKDSLQNPIRINYFSPN